MTLTLLDPEEWRTVPGWDGRYDVSSHGRVRTWIKRVGSQVVWLDDPVLRKFSRGGKGGVYPIVVLCIRGKMKAVAVHTLVARAFLGEPPPGHEVAHDDGNGDHNWAANLAWKTPKNNQADKVRHGTQKRGEEHHKSKLKEAQVREIKASPEPSATAIARKYGVDPYTIYAIRTGKTWRHI